MPLDTRVLALDDAGAEATALRHMLAAAGHQTMHATSVDEAVAMLRSAGAAVDVVLMDLAPAGLAGVTRLVVAASPARVVVRATDSMLPEGREALRLGAFDLVRRDDPLEAVLFAVERAAQAGQLLREVATLRARVGEQASRALVGRTAAIAAVRELVGRAAASRMPVLVTGEVGTGKSLVARLVHDLSERAARPFVTVRCAGAEPGRLDAELFGGGDAAGLCEEARGGTLVLEEFDALVPALRAKVARIITEGAVRGDAGAARVPVDVRLVLTARDDAASSRGLEGCALLPIALPPLRERRGDVPMLVHHFRARVASETGAALPPLAPDAMLALLGREWAGNVRELEHLVERAALTTPPPVAAQDVRPSGRLTLEELERRHILQVVAEERGNQSRAAERLGIDRRTLYRKLRQYRDGQAPLLAAG